MKFHVKEEDDEDDEETVTNYNITGEGLRKETSGEIEKVQKEEKNFSGQIREFLKNRNFCQ